MRVRGLFVATFRTGPFFVPLVVALTAIRFFAPTISAGLAVAGVRTEELDAAFGVYADLLPMVLFSFSFLVLHTWPGGLRRDVRMGLSFLAAIVAVVLWFGELEPSWRVVPGSTGSSALDLAVAATLLCFALALDKLLERRSASTLERGGLRALGATYTLAYLLGAVRLQDFRGLIGGPLPSGVLWLVDYTPVLALSATSLYFWLRLVVIPARGLRDWAWAIVAPAVIGSLGYAAAGGLGGYILANALAWGGSYVVFAPPSVSLPLVGFAVGAFLPVARILRHRRSRADWRLLIGGIAVTAFAGILSLGGALPSLAGIVLGVACAGRGLVEGGAGVDEEAMRSNDPRNIPA